MNVVITENEFQETNSCVKCFLQIGERKEVKNCLSYHSNIITANVFCMIMCVCVWVCYLFKLNRLERF